MPPARNHRGEGHPIPFGKCNLINAEPDHEIDLESRPDGKPTDLVARAKAPSISGVESSREKKSKTNRG
jgi:ABC-type uncharacterized transport system involved in gliding motility auxiliary subunit